MDLAWDVLRNYDLEARPLNLDDIVDYVCDVYHLSPEQLSSKSRKAAVGSGQEHRLSSGPAAYRPLAGRHRHPL